MERERLELTAVKWLLQGHVLDIQCRALIPKSGSWEGCLEKW